MPREAMVEDYQQLWKSITSGTNEPEAVRVLADKGGRDFISLLGRTEAELGIEVLDRVSR